MDEKTTKYMTFRLVEQKPKTGVYHVLNNSSGFLLGIIRWYGPWRQYCFFPEAQTLFNVGCMQDIIDFIGELREESR